MTPNAADLQRRARKLLPPEVYDYYAGGSGSERTLRANQKAWRRVWLAPRVLRDVSEVSTAATLQFDGAIPAAIALPQVVAALGTGADGVSELLAGLTAGLAHSMALAGAASIEEIADLHLTWAPGGPQPG